MEAKDSCAPGDEAGTRAERFRMRARIKERFFQFWIKVFLAAVFDNPENVITRIRIRFAEDFDNHREIKGYLKTDD